jgi:RNA polymerase sigma-70 factor (ECF subfamily)
MRHTFSDPHVTRTTLLLRLRRDGPEREIAWQEFYDYYAPLIGGFARRMGAASDVVEDVVQDVLLGFFSASPEFRYEPSLGRFRGYLKTCTWRKLRKHLEADHRIGGRCLRDVDTADLEVEAIWEDTWEREKLHRGLDLLRERYSTRPDKVKTFRAFEMSAMLERPAEGIAGELGMSIDSVHQAKSRVTRALRETMEAINAFAD